MKLKHLTTLSLYILTFAISYPLVAEDTLTLSKEQLLSADQAAQVICLSRAYLGSEEVLQSVETLQYEATTLDKEGNLINTLQMQMKKPFKQRVTWKSGQNIVIVASDGKSGFHIEKNELTEESNLEILSFEAVEMLIIGALENLYFYKGPEQRFGKTVVEGPVDWQGQQAYKISSIYNADTQYVSFVNATTGKLLAAIDRFGFKSVDAETTIIKGIVFPSKIIVYDQEGQLHSTVVFDKILVNEPIEDSLFEFSLDIAR